jgi:hypothetical protein
MEPKEQSEIIKNYVSILAILTAAIWTLYVFYQKDWSTLEPRLDGSGQIEWKGGRVSDTCRAVFRVSLENQGIRSLEVKKVRIRAWEFSEPTANSVLSKKVYSIDFGKELVSQNLVSDISYKKGKDIPLDDTIPAPLVAHYAPGVKYNHSFEWEVKRDPGKVFFVRVDLYKKTDQSQTPWYMISWSSVCEGVKKDGGKSTDE